MLKTIILGLSVFIGQQLSAQQLHCGTGLVENAQIKSRLLQNRATQGAVAKSQSITYIPITFHLVGDGNGENFPSPMTAIMSLCALNEDFLSQNIQFYLNLPLRYFSNQDVYDDGYDWGSMSIMGNAKVNNTFNIYIGNAVSQPVAGYYSPSQDFVFIRRGEANRVSNTLTHEAGHFFTLPHTFYGWEGENYDNLFAGQPAPTQINGNAVEYAARSGANANCATAADGFCDTEADYYSYRVSCGYSSNVLDPDSARVRPNERYYMSYYGDACMDSFSDEQQQAIRADINARGWANFAPPTQAVVNNDSLQAIYPALGEVVTTGNNRFINFRWRSSEGAEAYIWSLERYFIGQPVGVVEMGVVYNDTSYNFDAAVLTQRGEYRWTVYPFNRYQTCASLSKTFDFQIGNLVGLEENSSQVKRENPVRILSYQNQTLRAKIYSTSEQEQLLAVYNSNGQLVLSQKSFLQTGDNFINIQFLDLPQGFYLLRCGDNSQFFSSF